MACPQACCCRAAATSYRSRTKRSTQCSNVAFCTMWRNRAVWSPNIEVREQDGNYVVRAEVQYGYFARVIPLPDGANVDLANAKFDNGVLEITIPVAQQQNTKRQIPVQGSSANTGDGSATNTGDGSAEQGSTKGGHFSCERYSLRAGGH